MTEERKKNKKQRTETPVVAALLQSAAASAGVAVPPSRLVEKLPADNMAQMLGMLSLREGVRLRNVSKVPGNRFVLPENKFPALDSVIVWRHQVNAIVESDLAAKTLRHSLRLVRSLELQGANAARLLSKLQFTQLRRLCLVLFHSGDLGPLAEVKLQHLQELNLISYQRGDLRPLA